MLFYGNNCLAAINRERDGSAVKNITIAGVLLNDFVISVREPAS